MRVSSVSAFALSGLFGVAACMGPAEQEGGAMEGETATRGGSGASPEGDRDASTSDPEKKSGGAGAGVSASSGGAGAVPPTPGDDAKASELHDAGANAPQLDSSEGEVGIEANLGEACTSVDECVGVKPLCQLRAVSPAIYTPPFTPASGTAPQAQPDRCASDADCAATPETPYCLELSPDPLIGRGCGACQAQSDCELGSCEWGVCFVECQKAADCGLPEVMVCDRGVCAAQTCSEDDHCEANAFCNVSSGVCAPSVCESAEDCAAGSCIEGVCTTLPGRCIDLGAVDPDPVNCVCGEGRICVLETDASLQKEHRPRRCEPLPDGCDTCRCAESVLCPEFGACSNNPTSPHLTCAPFVQ